ncbi:ribonuclease III [Diplogelasinospora grovesii]|uniref:Ribonuclease III n=1 Tax=Diplogelasinospora grovesii TaxID=303347 RepID=A0AAN6NJL5_9PEZI|nr:ribonuclease III [Diplogelasinospora grovesii]
MGKRNRSEFANGSTGTVEPVTKRKKPAPGQEDDALEVLLENADALIECIRSLKSQKSKSDRSIKVEDLEPTTRKSLSSLSVKLLPALQKFASQQKSPQPALQSLPSQQQVEEPNEGPKIQIPPAAVTKWTAASITKSYPPLPAVLDPVLETMALTHSGMTPANPEMSYERLEWIGDAYLEIIASCFIYQTFPKLPPGECSLYREQLIRNVTLAAYARHYGLDKRANFPAEFGFGGRPGGTTATEKQREKALGDIFEAYVGAIILSDPQNGVQRVSDWLKVLWGGQLEKHIVQEEKGTKLAILPNTSPKTLLETAIGVKGIKIEYRDLPAKQKKDRDNNLPLFTVGCFLHGWGETNKQLGFGSATGKKEAGHKAAQMALDNKKLINVYINKKKAFLAAREAEAAAKAAAEEEAAAGQPVQEG